MIRFVAIAWDALDPKATSRVRATTRHMEVHGTCSWLLALERPALCVWTSRTLECRSPLFIEQSAIIVGELFRRIDPTRSFSQARIHRLTSTESREIVSTKGDCLFRRYWGSFVAILSEGENGGVEILRDPAGELPCYFVEEDGITIAFSDAADCSGVHFPKLEVDWDYVSRFISFPGLSTPSTGLRNVKELFPGQRLNVSHGRAGKVETLWRPTHFGKLSKSRNADQGVTQIRRTVDHTVWNLSSTHTSAVLELSGGLDSSVLLSSLSRAPTAVALTCLNHFTPGSALGDERTYARLMAGHAGTSLIEVCDEASLDLTRLEHVRVTTHPLDYIASLFRGSELDNVVTSRRATAAFSGTGGDQAFFSGPVNVALSDLLQSQGFTRTFIKSLITTAVVTGQQVFSLLREVTRVALALGDLRHRYRIASGQAVFSQNPISIQYEQLATHPWLDEMADLPFGKQLQIAQLALPHNPYDPIIGRDAQPDIYRPFLSQPVLELALSVPTYALSANGRSRDAVRNAFADLIPTKITNRMTKGAVDFGFPQVLSANLSFVREVLLEGHLVKHGLLNRPKLEEALRNPSALAGFQASEILCLHVCIEMWARAVTQAAHIQRPSVGPVNAATA